MGSAKRLQLTVVGTLQADTEAIDPRREKPLEKTRGIGDGVTLHRYLRRGVKPIVRARSPKQRGNIGGGQHGWRAAPDINGIHRIAPCCGRAV